MWQCLVSNIDVTEWLDVDSITFTEGKEGNLLFSYYLGDVSLSFLSDVLKVIGDDPRKEPMELLYNGAVKFRGYVRGCDADEGMADEVILDCISVANAICNTSVAEIKTQDKESGDDIFTIVRSALANVHEDCPYELPENVGALGSVSVLDNIDFIQYQSYKTDKKGLPKYDENWILWGVFQSSKQSERDNYFLIFWTIDSDDRNNDELVHIYEINNQFNTYDVSDSYQEVYQGEQWRFSRSGTLGEKVINSDSKFIPELPFITTDDSPRSYIRRNTVTDPTHIQFYIKAIQELETTDEDDVPAVEITSSSGGIGRTLLTAKVENDEKNYYVFTIQDTDRFKYEFTDTTVKRIIKALCVISDSLFNIDYFGNTSLQDRDAHETRKYTSINNLSLHRVKKTAYYDRAVSVDSGFKVLDIGLLSVTSEVENHYKEVANGGFTLTKVNCDIDDDQYEVGDILVTDGVEDGIIVKKSYTKDTVKMEVEKRA